MEIGAQIYQLFLFRGLLLKSLLDIDSWKLINKLKFSWMEDLIYQLIQLSGPTDEIRPVGLGTDQ